MTSLNAPWTQEQVDNLNYWQDSGVFHPYTCGKNSDHILVATTAGWVCPRCDYTQPWAHDFTATLSQP